MRSYGLWASLADWRECFASMDSDTCSPLMLRKQLKAGNMVTRFMGISRRLERMFRLNGLGSPLP